MYKDIKEMVLDGATYGEVVSAMVDGEPTEEETEEIRSAYDRAIAEIDGAVDDTEKE